MSAAMLPSLARTEPTLHSSSTPGRRVFGERPFRTDADVVALNFAGEELWSLEEGGTLRCWELPAGRQAQWRSLGEDATLWQFRDDGRLLAGAGLDVSLWDVPSGRREGFLPQDSWVTALAFAPDSDLIATGHDDGLIHLWDAQDGRLVLRLRGHQRAVSALAFSQDGKRLVSAGEEKLMLVWDVQTGEIRGLLGGHTDRIPAVAWHPNGRRILSIGWDTSARIWDVETCEPIILLNGHASQVLAMALSADGSLLACADSANAVHLWDTKSNQVLRVLEDAEAEIRCLTFNADGALLAAGGADRFIHLWDTRTGAQLGGRAELPGLAVGLSLSPANDRLARVDGSGLRVWDVQSGELVVDLPKNANAVAYSPDGQWLAVAGDELELLDSATGGSRLHLEGPRPPLHVVAFATSSPLVAVGGTASADIWIWDTRSGEPALLIPDAVAGCTVQALAFHPRRPLLAIGGCDWFEATGADGIVTLWDVEARRREALLGGGAMALAFDPTGRRLAVASADHVIHVWDIPGRRLLGEWTAHSDTIRGLAFSPDGSRLASGSDDRTVRLWEPESGHLVGAVSLASQVKTLLFAGDGQSLFLANGNGSCMRLPIWELRTETLMPQP
jgi:WD40 repeat protein